MVSYLATAMLAVGVLTSSPQPVEWNGDYGKALAATRSGNQPLLVVLDKPGTADASVEPALLSKGQSEGQDAELLHHYQLCHVDATTDYGQKVAKAFDAKTLPHTAIIDKSGSVVIYSKSGKIDGREWNTALAKYRDGERPLVRKLRHVSMKLTDGTTQSTATMEPSEKPVRTGGSYCPNCQRKAH